MIQWVFKVGNGCKFGIYYDYKIFAAFAVNYMFLHLDLIFSMAGIKQDY